MRPIQSSAKFLLFIFLLKVAAQTSLSLPISDSQLPNTAEEIDDNDAAADADNDEINDYDLLLAKQLGDFMQTENGNGWQTADEMLFKLLTAENSNKAPLQNSLQQQQQLPLRHNELNIWQAAIKPNNWRKQLNTPKKTIPHATFMSLLQQTWLNEPQKQALIKNLLQNPSVDFEKECNNRNCLNDNYAERGDNDLLVHKAANNDADSANDVANNEKSVEWTEPQTTDILLQTIDKRQPRARLASNRMTYGISPGVGEKQPQHFQMPHYPVGVFGANAQLNPQLVRGFKREKMRTQLQATKYFPSISPGAITNLGSFFGDLSKNVHFNEHSKFGQDDKHLLSGNHPLKMIQQEFQQLPERYEQQNQEENDKLNEKTANFISTLRSYRPSQKIRSLVAMNPPGYHGSHFIDPNYMWIGLGK